MKRSELQYREAVIADIPEIAALHNKLVYFIQQQTRDDYWNFEELNIDDTANYLNEFYHSPNCKIYVADHENKIIGFIMGEVIRCHLPVSKISEVGYISAAYIREDYQRNGIMKRLEEDLTQFFRKFGIKYVEVNFLYKNSGAKNCWEALGYNIFREQARKELL